MCLPCAYFRSTERRGKSRSLHFIIPRLQKAFTAGCGDRTFLSKKFRQRLHCAGFLSTRASPAEIYFHFHSEVVLRERNARRPFLLRKASLGKDAICNEQFSIVGRREEGAAGRHCLPAPPGVLPVRRGVRRRGLGALL